MFPSVAPIWTQMPLKKNAPLDVLESAIAEAVEQAALDVKKSADPPVKAALKAWTAALRCVQASGRDRSTTYVQFQLCAHRTAQCKGHISHSLLQELLPVLRGLATKVTVV